MRLLIITTLLMTMSAHADIVARVLEANGDSFAFESNGKSKQLKFGGRVSDFSEIMVDDGGTLSLLDSLGNVHHLAGGTYVKFFNRMLEIKNGKVWTVIKEEKPALINTVNAVVTAQSGQVVVSVDNSNLKTQALALTGSASLASSIEPQLSIDVPAGHFSFIDNAYEGGLPRAATRVGLRSYQTMKVAFNKVRELNAEGIDSSFGKRPSRKIASVKTAPVKWKEKGKIIYFKSTSRTPASVSKKVSASDYYQTIKKSSASKKDVVSKLPNAKVRMHGFNFSKKEAMRKAAIKKADLKGSKEVSKRRIVIKTNRPKKVKKKIARLPASVGGGSIVSDINSAFEKSLKTKVESNRKHSTEVNQLIDELESFKKDYSKHY